MSLMSEIETGVKCSSQRRLQQRAADAAETVDGDTCHGKSSCSMRPDSQMLSARYQLTPARAHVEKLKA